MVEGREITDQEEIIQVMQSWYEDTAMNTTELTMTLEEFLGRYNILLHQGEEQVKKNNKAGGGRKRNNRPRRNHPGDAELV